MNSAELTKDAFDIVWQDMAWRKELASQRRPLILGSLLTEALLNAGWSYIDEISMVDMFSIYKEAMQRVDSALEECQSGRYTDGLYFYDIGSFETDLRDMHKFISANDL